MHKARGPAVRPPFEPLEAFRLAARGVYFGTSSWKYRGWEGVIYQGGYASEALFQRESLREYTAMLPCVGVDFTYYSWPMPDMMSYLVQSAPENFRLCPKVTKRITMSAFPNLPTYGRWAGQKNPDYLDAAAFEDKFLAPMRMLSGRVGLIQFEFSGPEEDELGKLESFFSRVPRDFPYAVEIRNPGLVNPEFYSFLRGLGLSPVFSAWTRMPSIGKQWQTYLEAGGGSDQAPLLGLGMLRPGRPYEEAVQLFQPYREIRDPYEEGRHDLADLAHWAMEKGRKVYIIVSNRLEGSAPLTIGRVMDLLTAGKRA
ncbi:MAG TPA: DUF72 domain-containing protein [Bdellovibrionota bacterium]|jgi:uncharacterized protein YecE (DUF72 family)